MKFLFAAVLSCTVFVVVMSEGCRRPDDCKFEVCDASASHIACHLGECTCDKNLQSGCKLASDCQLSTRCRFLHHRMHCVDGYCKCY